MKRLVLIVVFLSFTGCVAPWTQVGGLYTAKQENFTVELPKGWMKYNQTNKLLVTRDGLLLQNILIERLAIDSKLKHTKKKLSKDMLPQEVAELMIDAMSSDQEKLKFQVLENVPARIAGNPGAKIIYTFKNNDGLRRKSIYYVFITEQYFYGIKYTAAARHYFDKDRDVFEKVLQSFKVIKKA